MFGGFRNQIKKSQQPYKSPYTIFTNISSPLPLHELLKKRASEKEFIQIVSIDPVKKRLDNFAIRVERRFFSKEAGRIETMLYTKIDMADISEAKKSGKKDSIQPNLFFPRSEIKKEKEETKEIEDVVEDCFSETFPIEKIEKVEKKKKDKEEDETDRLSSIYHQVTHFLEKHRELLKESDLVIVERQLSVNYFAVRLSQHVLSYFMCLLHLEKKKEMEEEEGAIILEIDPKLKTKELDAPKGINEKQVKQFCIDKGIEILEERGDKKSLDVLERYRTLKKVKKSQRKLDDLCDTVCQIEALLLHLGIIKKK